MRHITRLNTEGRMRYIYIGYSDVPLQDGNTEPYITDLYLRFTIQITDKDTATIYCDINDGEIDIQLARHDTPRDKWRKTMQYMINLLLDTENAEIYHILKKAGLT